MDATTFPISFTWHLVFSILACVFFLIQYVRMKKSYQLLIAIGIPASLCIYIQPEDSTLFYTVGAFEIVLLLGALVFAFIERSHRQQELDDTTPLPPEMKPDEAVSAAEPESTENNTTNGENA
ncbi:MAG: hypothetical protein ACI4JQ_01120 [Ruminococcus sp.]